MNDSAKASDDKAARYNRQPVNAKKNTKYLRRHPVDILVYKRRTRHICKASLSGAYSHYREGNIQMKIGLIVGGFAAVGSFFGAKLTSFIPADLLHYLTAGMLFLSAILILIRLFILKEKAQVNQSTLSTYTRAVILGIAAGVLSGTFGIGSAPFIQIGLMIMLNLSIRHSVGTTMLVIIPLAVGGGIGYITEGFVDYVLLVKVLVGTMCGAYVGAKFTNLMPKVVLKSAIFLTPAIAGLLLLF